jgi:CheY-like chemotaxis protein
MPGGRPTGYKTEYTMNTMFETRYPGEIVLAEDNPEDVRFVREALREHGVRCKLRILSDGDEVVSFIDRLDEDSKRPCPDLMLLDFNLPKRDGREVLKYLRASERCGRTPVVVLTSSDSPADRETAERNAAIHYFTKSTSLDQFMLLGTIIKGLVNTTQREP